MKLARKMTGTLIPLKNDDHFKFLILNILIRASNMHYIEICFHWFLRQYFNLFLTLGMLTTRNHPELTLLRNESLCQIAI